MLPPRLFENFTWKILPGRRVCHAIKKGFYRNVHKEAPFRSFCGQSNYYPETLLLDPSKDTKQCEQCLIRLVALAEDDPQWSRAWRKFLCEHPEYGPASWRDRSLGARHKTP